MVRASRDFVCVRPATYESEEEAKFLLDLFGGAGGQLQNTIFAVLAPDGRTRLARSGRGPSFAFTDGDDMARELERMAERFEPSDEAASRSLPTVTDLRLGLNVAACDSLPLVVGVLRHDDDASDDERAAADNALRARLAALCFDERSIGRAHYVVVEGDEGLRAFEGFEGVDAEADVFLLAPDAYGIEAKVLAATKSTGEKLVPDVVTGLNGYRPRAKDARSHVRNARRAGIEWESELPVTDRKAPRSKR